MTTIFGRFEPISSTRTLKRKRGLWAASPGAPLSVHAFWGVCPWRMSTTPRERPIRIRDHGGAPCAVRRAPRVRVGAAGAGAPALAIPTRTTNAPTPSEQRTDHLEVPGGGAVCTGAHLCLCRGKFRGGDFAAAYGRPTLSLGCPGRTGRLAPGHAPQRRPYIPQFRHLP